jgi:hypothetical protein
MKRKWNVVEKMIYEMRKGNKGRNFTKIFVILICNDFDFTMILFMMVSNLFSDFHFVIKIPFSPPPLNTYKYVISLLFVVCFFFSVSALSEAD